MAKTNEITLVDGLDGYDRIAKDGGEYRYRGSLDTLWECAHCLGPAVDRPTTIAITCDTCGARICTSCSQDSECEGEA